MRYSSRMLVAFLFTVCAMTSIAYTSGHETGPRKAIKNQNTDAKPSKQLEAAAFKLVSQQRNVPLAFLELESSTIVTYPNSERKVNEFNFGDTRNDNAYQILLDDNAVVIDEAKLVQEEEAARFAKYGKLSQDLFQYLQQALADEEIGVLIWLDLGPDTDRPKDESSMDSQKFKTMTPEQQQQLVQQLEDFDRRLKAYNDARAQRVTGPIVQRLSQLGYQSKVLGNSGHLYLKLKPAMIKTVEAWPEVRQVSRGDRLVQPAGGPPPRSAVLLDISRPTIGADLVENRGINGQNAYVGQIEVGGRIIPNPGIPNPYLNNITEDDTDICAGVSEHSCAVAGVIHSSATLPPVYRGIAPGSQMTAAGSCAGVVQELEDRTTAAINVGAIVLNHSWSSNTQDGFGNNVLDPIDQFFDDRVYTDRVLQVAAAGNNGDGFGDHSGRITSPAKGYNTISVGNFNTMETVNWNDDAMDPSSSSVPPVSAHQAQMPRIKPEVTAPGTLIDTTLAQQHLGQWFGDHFSDGTPITGTSFSAPHVTGEAGLIISRAVTTYGLTNFRSRPELVKAIIMASAGHNNIPGLGAGLGGISASWADDVVDWVQRIWWLRTRPRNLHQLALHTCYFQLTTWPSYPHRCRLEPSPKLRNVFHAAERVARIETARSVWCNNSPGE